jgi:hypothetical protein
MYKYRKKNVMLGVPSSRVAEFQLRITQHKQFSLLAIKITGSRIIAVTMTDNNFDSPTEAAVIDNWRTACGDAIDGYIKLKLLHARGVSLVLPEFLVADLGGMKWLQPKFFYPCTLGFFDSFCTCHIGIELSDGTLVHTFFSSSGFVTSLNDRSQIFRCIISNTKDLGQATVGRCTLDQSGDFLLHLFHHTNIDSLNLIHKSGHYRGSPWNIQGTRKLKNVEYAYFTSIPKISSNNDLLKIAMSSSGEIRLLRTNAASPLDAIYLTVYRESTANRTATLETAVPSRCITSRHIYRHAPEGNPVYYEICNPDIYRVGLLPGCVAPFNNGVLEVANCDLKRFEYVVLGDADTREGLIAPYDEEETRSLFHIEDCRKQTFLDFWHSHSNSDLVSKRKPELLEFKQ